MPTENVRPNSKLNSAWGAGNTHLSLDDAVTQPSAGGGDVVSLNDSYSGAVQQYTCNAPANSGTITSAKIWVYRASDNNNDSDISAARVRLNGTWYSTGAFSGSYIGGSYGWISATATGSYGDMSTSAPAVELTFATFSPDGTMDIDVVYLELTYSTGSVNTSNFFQLF